MPNIWNSLTTSWADGSALWNSLTTSWADGARLWASPSAYTMPAPPAGGTLAYPTPGSAVAKRISASSVYRTTHSISAVDTRDLSSVPLTSVSISTDADSSTWTLRAAAASSAFNQLTTGDSPATLEVTVAGITWAFVVDSVGRSRAHNDNSVSIVGRSVTAAAATPFQPDSNWINTGATTGAQMAALSNSYTGVEVAFEVTDWIIPDGVFAFSGTPFGVVRRVAEAVGAIVRSDRREPILYVSPRYPSMPNEWEVTPADVEVAFEAVETESFERSDRPSYTGVYMAGQQGGAFGFARLAGTNGSVLHPFVTDLLLTDQPALQQRGRAILGASGEQAQVTLALPVLTGANEPGVLELNQIVRVLDPAGAWAGIVRGVSVNASHEAVRQQVVLERHTKLIDGTYELPPAPVTATYKIVGNTAYGSGDHVVLSTDSALTGQVWPSITAPADVGTNRFIRWSDGITSRTRSGVPVTGPLTVTAEYAQAVPIRVRASYNYTQPSIAPVPYSSIYAATLAVQGTISYAVPGSTTILSSITPAPASSAGYGGWGDENHVTQSFNASYWTGRTVFDDVVWTTDIVTSGLASEYGVDYAEYVDPLGPVYFPPSVEVPGETITMKFRFSSSTTVYTVTATTTNAVALTKQIPRSGYNSDRTVDISYTATSWSVEYT